MLGKLFFHMCCLTGQDTEHHSASRIAVGNKSLHDSEFERDVKMFPDKSILQNVAYGML